MKIRNIALTTLALCSSSVLFAEENKFYFGAELGSVKVENRAQEVANETVAVLGGSATVTQTVRNGASRIFGGYKLNENLDLELGYTQTQSFKLSIAGTAGAGFSNTQYAASGSVKVSGFDYSVLLRPSKDTGFNDFFLRVGGHNLSSKASLSMTVGGNAVSIPSSKTSGTGTLFGVGYDWNVDKNLSVRFGLTQLNKVSGISGSDATYLSVGVKGSF